MYKVIVVMALVLIVGMFVVAYKLDKKDGYL